MTPTVALPNPLIPGFNPDPSIVLVDGVYYLVTSTFEYLPGLPVYRSTDLREWTLIGNIITRPEQAELENVPTPGGVWAPTIRHRDGVFYIIVTIMLGGRGCVVFTATDAAGPWSDGVPIEAVDGIDPDLAWDDDGNAYVTYARMGAGIQQVRVDLDTGQALESPRPLWSGTLYAPEGPHLYHRGEYWYLLIAEGGTERGHAISIARGRSPEGPFEPHPDNPLLSSRSTNLPVQNIGHADLVDTVDGGAAMVMLGVRPVGFTHSFSPLGRETFITRVDWVDNWPRPRPLEMTPRVEIDDTKFDFAESDTLDDPGWIAVRRNPGDVGTLTDTPGRLTINGTGKDLRDRQPSFLGRRQRHLTATFATRVDTRAGTGGLAARHDEDHWFALQAESSGSITSITARAGLAGFERSWHCDLPGGEVELRIEMTEPPTDRKALSLGGDRIRLLAAAGGQQVLLAELDGRYWSFETAKSFTGRVVGLYAVHGAVTFADFVYRGTNKETE